MGLDWSSEGVDWRDESLDDAMARDWLEATHGPSRVPMDVWDRVLELTQTDLDPPRGWRLAKRLVELATTDRELWLVGRDVLATIAREHWGLIAAELEELYRTDQKWRQAFEGQMSPALIEIQQRAEGGDSATKTEPI